MPEPPSANLITQYMFENPWPAGIPLVTIALILGWMGLRQGLQMRVNIAAAIGAVGVLIILAGFLVKTSGEHAKELTTRLVEAAVSDDTVGALACFSKDVTVTIGSPENPGFGYEFIQDRMIHLHERYTIDTNRITELNAYSVASHVATVHLSCMTTVGQFPYPNTSKWVLEIERQPDESWQIIRLTCVSINGRQPPSQLW